MPTKYQTSNYCFLCDINQSYACGLSISNLTLPPIADGLQVLAQYIKKFTDDVKIKLQVKVVPPDGDLAWLDSISPLSGQLLGEMILEIPHSAIDHKDGDLTMSSFAVQGTKVCLKAAKIVLATSNKCLFLTVGLVQ